MKKQLDTKAFVLVLLIISSVGMLLYVRSYFSQLAIDTRVGVVAADQKQQLWLAVPNKVIVLNMQGNIIKTIDSNTLAVPDLVADIVFGKSGTVWMKDIKGKVYRCPNENSACQSVDIFKQVKKPEYAKLTAAPDGHIALTDNWQGQVYFANDKAQLVSHSRRGVLNHPNGALFTNEGFVQADTGGFRLIRWPYIKNTYQPDFNADYEVLFKTADLKRPSISRVVTPADAQKIGEALAIVLHKQPYFFDRMTDGTWWVLESGTVLDKGFLKQYDAKGKGLRTVDLPETTDVTSLAKLGQHNLILADSFNSKLIDVYYQKSQFLDSAVLTVNSFGDAQVRKVLDAVNEVRSHYRLIAKACLILIAMLPVLAILLFWRLGYDLNAKI